jgi:hypothetical protein
VFCGTVCIRQAVSINVQKLSKQQQQQQQQQQQPKLTPQKVLPELLKFYMYFMCMCVCVCACVYGECSILIFPVNF